MVSPRKVESRCKATWKRKFKSHGARPVHLITTMMKWIWTSRLSLRNSISLGEPGLFPALKLTDVYPT